MSVQIDSSKPHRPRMPDDVGEGNAASPALRRVHPVPAPGIRNRVPVAAVPDIESVERVERDRQPDPKQLKKEHEGKIAEKAYLPGISIGAADGGRVGN